MALWYAYDPPFGIILTPNPHRNLIPGKQPKKASPSIMKVSSWAIKSVSSYPMVVDGRQSMPGNLVRVSSVGLGDTGRGLLYI